MACIKPALHLRGSQKIFYSDVNISQNNTKSIHTLILKGTTVESALRTVKHDLIQHYRELFGEAWIWDLRVRTWDGNTEQQEKERERV